MRSIRGLRLDVGLALALVTCGGLLAQEARPPQQGPPPQGQPPPGDPAKDPAKDPAAKPKLQILPQRPQPGRRPSGANLPVASIEKLRNQKTVAIARSATSFDLDLSGVDWKKDPVLIMNGAPITRAQVDRQLCLVVGANEIEQFVTAILLKNVKKELAAKGQPVAEVPISEADVQKKFDEDKKVLPQFSGISPDEYERQIKEVFGWSHYVEFQKLQLEFERILLPDPSPEFMTKQKALWEPMEAKWKADVDAKLKELQKPGQPPPKPNDPEVAKQLPVAPVPDADLSWIPSITFELMDARFAQVVKDNYARGQPMHPLIRQAVVGPMRANLLKGLDVKMAPPEDAENFLFVGSEPVKLKELLALVSGRADDSMRRVALRELLNLAAADLRLAAEKAVETPAETDAALKSFEAQYANSILPLAQAVRLFGFSSLWHYRPFFARKHAYHELFKKTTSEENLRAHFDEAGRLFFESGTCVAEVLFVPGPDRAAAKSAMDGLLGEVVAGKPFAVLAHDPAINKFPDGGNVKQGQIAPSMRTNLRMALGENEYVTFLTGYSLADEAFYVAKEDSIVGPAWRDFSPKLTGWVALHVDRYFTTGQRHTFEEAKEQVLEDMVDLTFPKWVNQALSTMSVEFPK
jgi:hypothetical protein